MRVNWRALCFCASLCVSIIKNLQKLCQKYTLPRIYCILFAILTAYYLYQITDTTYRNSHTNQSTSLPIMLYSLTYQQFSTYMHTNTTSFLSPPAYRSHHTTPYKFSKHKHTTYQHLHPHDSITSITSHLWNLLLSNLIQQFGILHYIPNYLPGSIPNDHDLHSFLDISSSICTLQSSTSTSHFQPFSISLTHLAPFKSTTPSPLPTTSRKHGKKEPQSFSHCGSFDHHDQQSVDDCRFVFFGLQIEILRIWGLLIYR